MGFQKLCFGILLITASVINVNSLPKLSESQQLEVFVNQLPNNIRTRRSTEDDTVASLIADLICQGKREIAFLIYSKEIKASETTQNELIKQIVSHAYRHKSAAVSKLIDFITLELNDSTEILFWLKSIFEAVKENKDENIVTLLYLGRAAKRIARLELLKADQDKECNLKLLTETVSSKMVGATKRVIDELAKSIESGNTSPVITAATKYPVIFDSIVQQLISTVVGLNNNTNNGKNLVERLKNIFDFIPNIPSLTTSIDALAYLNEILNNLKPNFISMSEGVMFAYSVKKLETKVESTNELSLNYKQKFSELKNQIPLGIKWIVEDPYVFIYKIDKTQRKFVSTMYVKDHITRYSVTTNEHSLWVLEPINNADQFRIKNQGTGEYLCASDKKSIKKFPNKRFVLTRKISDPSNNSFGDRLVWVVAPVLGTNANRFTIMNLHFKEYLDSHEELDTWDDHDDDHEEDDTPNNVHTWKDKIEPPASANDWIISFRGAPESQQENRLVCFYDSLATQKEGAGRFTPDNIDSSKCTHLIYNRAIIDSVTNAMKIGHEQTDIIEKGYEKCVALKQKNPKLKVLIAIGGLEVEEYYSHLNSHPEKMKKLVESIINFLQIYKFDGIHFELQILKSVSQKNGATSLLKALHKALGKNYLLSAHIHDRNLGYYEVTYDMRSLNEVLDFMGLQAFNFHGPWESRVLYTKYTDSSRIGISSTDAESEVHRIIKQGFSPSKIILDLPFIVNTWKLSTKDGEKTSQMQMAYYEICELVQSGKWNGYQDPIPMGSPQDSSPSFSDQRAYDDSAMIILKANYILSQGLGGAYVTDVSQDDFRNACGGGVNRLLTAIAKAFGIKASN